MVKLLIGLIVIFILLFVIVLLEGNRELGHLKISRYTIETSKVDNNIKLAFVSDYHNNKRIKDKILKSIQDEKVDIILIGGDMCVCRRQYVDKNIESAYFTKELSDIAPVYYGIGNHECGLMHKMHMVEDNWKKYCEIIKTAPVYLLDNKALDYKGLHISGITVPMYYYQRLKSRTLPVDTIRESIGENTGQFNILLAHNPEYFDSYVQYGADLVLSGHNHGGLMILPLLGGVLSSRLHPFPKYDYGYFEKNKTRMVLSRGLGCHSPVVRFNNYPELIFIDIMKKKNT